jgi:hypothetical protein
MADEGLARRRRLDEIKPALYAIEPRGYAVELALYAVDSLVNVHDCPL